MVKNKLIVGAWNPAIRNIKGINKNVLIYPYKEGGKIKYKVRLAPEEKKKKKLLWKQTIDDGYVLYIIENITTYEGEQYNLESTEEFMQIQLTSEDNTPFVMTINDENDIELEIDERMDVMTTTKSGAFKKLNELSKSRPELFTPNVINSFKEAYNNLCQNKKFDTLQDHNLLKD